MKAKAKGEMVVCIECAEMMIRRTSLIDQDGILREGNDVKVCPTKMIECPSGRHFCGKFTEIEVKKSKKKYRVWVSGVSRMYEVSAISEASAIDQATDLYLDEDTSGAIVDSIEECDGNGQ
jgi:hypothetical protein